MMIIMCHVNHNLLDKLPYIISDDSSMFFFFFMNMIRLCLGVILLYPLFFLGYGTHSNLNLSYYFPLILVVN